MKSLGRFIRICGIALLAIGSPVRAARAQTSNPPQEKQPRVLRDPERARQRIIREVHHELVLLSWYSVFDNLAYKVEGDRVTLLGHVVRPVLKADAEAVVKRIEGVAKVVNNIEVLPLSPNDDRIRRAVYRAIYGNPVLERYALQAVPPIHIIVKNGNVTLEGVVATEMEKNVAKIQASGVSGTFSVTDHLRVEKESK
jgi:hyperosmotically inducible protein